MKSAYKLIGFFALIILLALGSFAIYSHFNKDTSEETPKYEVKVVASSRMGGGNVEIGEKIVYNLCVSCHLNSDGDLSGRVLMDHPQWGYITTGNLTRHASSDVSKYTDKELFFFLKTGIKNDGSMALPMMPKFATMSDEDLNSVITFLKSDHEWLTPRENNIPASKPGSILASLMDDVIKPLPFDEQPVRQVSKSDEVAYGSYLVNGRYACYECHSRSTERINYLDPPSTPGYLAGGSRLNVFGSDIGIRSANLTPHEEYGIGGWTFGEFENAIRHGKRPDGKQLRPPMNRMTLDSIEVRAIWKYLQTVDPSDAEWKYEDRMVIESS